MASAVKISGLTALTTPADDDLFEIVDDSEVTPSDKNKRLTWKNLRLGLATKSAIDTDHTAWNIATTYDSANIPIYVSYQSRLYSLVLVSGTDTGTTPGTDDGVWWALDASDIMYPPATDAETTTGTATNRYLTPANLASQAFLTTSVNIFNTDGTLTGNRVVTLSAYNLDINLDSTGSFAIQDGGTDMFKINADTSFGIGLNTSIISNTNTPIGNSITITAAKTNVSIFGYNSSATASNATVIGALATVTGGGAGGTVIGYNSTATTGVSIGSGVSSSTGVAIGLNSSAGAGTSVGNGATNAQSGTTSVGAASVSVLNGTAVGASADAGQDGTSVGASTRGERDGISIGYGASTASNGCVLIGANSSGSASGASVLQFYTGASFNQNLTNTLTNSLAIGGNSDTPTVLVTGGTASTGTFGRVGIGTGYTAPATSALLELSSTTGSLLLTRMTTTERNALTAVNGMMIYNTTTTAFNFYENGAWVTGSGLI